MDKKDLKIAALTQRIAELTAAYEERIADLRVELTVLSDQVEEKKETKKDKETALCQST